MVGNFIGDFVKGSDLDSYEHHIKSGIILHRLIDQFTDSHEIVKKSKERIRAKYGHYTAVIMDLYYDHFLAKNWSTYMQEELLSYTTATYKILDKYTAILPPQVHVVLKYMKADNWLFSYKTISGIGKALAGMSRRTKFDSKMDEATDLLIEHYQDLENDFFNFYPILVSYCKEKIEELQT